MPGMAAHPVPLHPVGAERGLEAPPQVFVLHRLLVGGTPAIALPLVDPLHDAVAQVLAVGVNVDDARTTERLERRSCGRQLHAIVGGERLATFEFLIVTAGERDRGPAARALIRRAGAVGIDGDMRLGHGCYSSMP